MTKEEYVATIFGILISFVLLHLYAYGFSKEMGMGLQIFLWN